VRDVRAMSRVGRENQIILAFQIKVAKSLGNAMTAYEIARKIDMRPTSPSFRRVLDGMVEKKILIAEFMDAPHRKVAGHMPKVYSLANHFTPPSKPRTVEVKSRNMVVAQLAMFDYALSENGNG